MKKIVFILTLLLAFTATNYAQEFGTGLVFSQEKYEEMPLSVPLVTRSFNSLPKSYSLKPYCPIPKSQGYQGSCVGWASAYGARTIAKAISNGWRNKPYLITANAHSPSFVYNQIRVNNKCQGAYIEDAMKVLNYKGSLKLKEFSYTDKSCLRSPNSYDLSKAKGGKILTFERLARWNNPSNLVSKVKKAIANKNPVVIGLSRYNKLTLDHTYTWIPNSGTKGHAMVVVGYDNYKNGGSFEVMNSWGNTWGNKGFLWIKYRDFERQVKTAYVLVDKKDENDNNNNNNNNNNLFVTNKLGGELKFKLSNGSSMPIALSKGASRGFSMVKVSKSTYRVTKSYSSGTQFRMYLKSKQRGYVYLVGYSGSDKSVEKLYPFDKFSDFFNYTNSEIALPNEDYFIELDNKPGKDILCVIYSKEKLDINSIVSKVKYGSGDFVSRVKGALGNKMFKGSSVKFSSNAVKFDASSTSSNAKVVPIFVEMNHI